jgi:hypothetical protein
LWEEGAKGPEGKSKLTKDKSQKIKPRDASPRDPRESNKDILSKKQEGPIKIIKQDLVRGWGLSSRASLLGPWVPSSITLLAAGYHARVVALGCMAKRKGVSSRANLLIYVKVLVGNTATTGHHARAVSLD